MSVSSILTTAGLVAYPGAVAWSSRQPSGWTLLLAALPLLWLAAGLARHWNQGPNGWLRVLPLAAMVALLGWAWDELVGNAHLLFLAQHAGIHAALCWLFWRSLLGGRLPLCTEMAAWVHLDVSSPRLSWYTRRVTAIWALFLGGMAAASVLLYPLLTPTSWLVFAGIISPLLTGALFVLENLARRHYLPSDHRVGLRGTWQAVRAQMERQHDRARAARPR